jgi:hypothetical protein
MPESIPEIPARTHAARVAALRERAAAHGLDDVLIWADREHSANLAWLSGFDPRFEDALLILGSHGDPAVLVGNECNGMAGAAEARVPARRHRSPRRVWAECSEGANSRTARRRRRGRPRAPRRAATPLPCSGPMRRLIAIRGIQLARSPLE